VTLRLSSIRVHPVKSTAIRPLQRALVEPWGLRGDRRWMVLTPDGEALTAREDPGLFRIVADTQDTAVAPGLGALGPPPAEPQPTGGTVDAVPDGGLRLRHPDLSDLLVQEPHGIPRRVSVHGRPLMGTEAPEAAEWLREALARPDVALVHVASPRGLNPQYARAAESTAFADGYPVTLASLASLRRLQDWMADTALQRGEEAAAPMTLDRFRPNLVVDGDLEPFAEDHWRRVSVGDVTFRVVKRVDRCVMTTIDPQDLHRGPEPIRTLARHRRSEGKTWFAMQLVPETTGQLGCGDAVRPRQ
jgi:uncharacterized protein YcbX